jgi:hypothetical protein
MCTLRLGLLLLCCIVLDPAKEFSLDLDNETCSTLTFTLLEIPISHPFVDNNTNCAFRDVVDDAGLAVVHLVWHTVHCQNPIVNNEAASLVFSALRCLWID